jgi:hypothetical protein
MTSQINTNTNGHAQQPNNLHNNNGEPSIESNQRPTKVQKINAIPGNNTSGSINIPEFMGNIPVIQHDGDKVYHHYSPTNLQFEEYQSQNQNQSQNQQYTQQDSQRSHQEQPRTNHNNNYNGNPSPGKDPFCMYNEEHIEDGVNLCRNTLIGKILSNKTILKSILQNNLQGIWGNPKGLSITEIEGGYVHISMNLEKDIQRIINGNPWLIRNSWFLVHPWDRKINPNNIDFLHVPAWIQIWGLPIHCKTANMGQHLGTQLGKVEESALYDYPQKARIVKIKVWINIEEPIRPGMFIGNTRDGINWVDFRYENLPMFCFSCGLVGHSEDKCENPALPLTEEGVNPRGPWLRSNIYGKRINESRDKRFHSNPMQSVSEGRFSPIPTAMVEMLARMKLAEEREEQDSPANTTKNAAEATDTTSSSTTKYHQQNNTPAKRKFLKNSTSQISYGIHNKESMVSLADKANQGP